MKTITNLQNLFETDFRLLPEKVIRDLEATEEVQQLRRDIREKIPHSNWSTMRQELLGELQKLLDIELQPIWIESWKSHQDVNREISKQLELQDDGVAIVTLTDHEIRSSHSPSLLVQIKDLTHPLRTFIGLTFNLENVTLQIQYGEIQQIISGTANGSGFLQYQNATLIEQDFLNFDISGKIKKKSKKAVGKRLGSVHDAPVQEPETATVDEPAKPQEQQLYEDRPTTSLKTNMIQFVVGVSIALIAVFLFWQFK